MAKDANIRSERGPGRGGARARSRCLLENEATHLEIALDPRDQGPEGGEGRTSVQSPPEQEAANLEIALDPRDQGAAANELAGQHLFDLHFHSAFAPKSASALAEAERLSIGGFSTTVTPKEYLAEREAWRETGIAGAFRLGVGLHPWWVADGSADAADVDLICELAQRERFIGEIGLDFGKRFQDQAVQERQLQAFTAIARACAQPAPDGKRVLSIHAVNAADVVLDILEREGCLQQCACIFHWFSGTSDQLTHARKAGCWFSVNPRMLASRRGAEYARTIPQDRLLLETDEPASEGEPLDAPAWRAKLEDALRKLAAIRNCDSGELACILQQNALLLLERD